MLFVLEKNAQGRSYVRLFARWALRSSNPRFLAKALHTSVLRCHTTLGLLQRPPRCRQLLPVASETNRGYHQPSRGTGKNGFFATPQRHRSVNHTIQFSRGSRSSEDFFFFRAMRIRFYICAKHGRAGVMLLDVPIWVIHGPDALLSRNLSRPRHFPSPVAVILPVCDSTWMREQRTQFQNSLF